MRRQLLLLLLLLGLSSVRCGEGLVFTDLGVDLKDLPAGTKKIDADLLRRIEGVYTAAAGEGRARFGDSIVVRERAGGVSIFCGTNAAFMVLQAGLSDDTLKLEGYWRYAYGTETGIASLAMYPDEGARALLDSSLPATSFIIHGIIGDSTSTTRHSIQFERVRSIRPDTTFQIIGHRGGGRNSDLHPYSENSLEMIGFAERLGCTGVEIDIQLTSDGIPVLYHDETLNTRLIQGDYLIGPLTNYTYRQLQRFVKLKRGENIPTLEEALQTVVEKTNLREVWLDIKSADVVRTIQPIVEQARNNARSRGRNVEFLSGIPDDAVLAAWKSLSSDTRGPAVCELDPSIVRSIDAAVWAPRWTLGAQVSEVQAMHAEGRRAFVWTLDQPALIAEFLRDAQYDAILTNYPTVLAWHDGMRR